VISSIIDINTNFSIDPRASKIPNTSAIV